MPRKATGGGTNDAGATRFCEVCKRGVVVGTGGDGNFRNHEKSAEHQAKLKAPEASRITSFFTKVSAPKEAPPHAASVPGPSKLPSLLERRSSELELELNSIFNDNPGPINDLDSDSDVEIISEPQPPARNHLRPQSLFPDSTSGHGSCLTCLENIVALLPPSPLTPTADVYNELARFVVPFPPLALYEEPCATISERIARVLPPERPLASLIPLIARGKHGVDGFLAYLHYCHRIYDIPFSVFDVPVSKLIFAIVALLVPHLPLSFQVLLNSSLVFTLFSILCLGSLR